MITCKVETYLYYYNIYRICQVIGPVQNPPLFYLWFIIPEDSDAAPGATIYISTQGYISFDTREMTGYILEIKRKFLSSTDTNIRKDIGLGLCLFSFFNQYIK